MCLSRNNKIYVYPCKPQFYYIKVGFNGVNIIKACFRDDLKTGCCISFNGLNLGNDLNERSSPVFSCLFFFFFFLKKKKRRQNIL